MIVYEATKKEFVFDTLKDEIALKIYNTYKEKTGRTSEREVNAWNNSMNYMLKVLNTPDIPDECGVAIEYKIPKTSNRIDFMLSGYDSEDRNSVIIIELKQWDKEIEAVTDRDGIVKTPYYGKTYTKHPSYQAWSYAQLISQYNESVQVEQVRLYPCAYLHNYFIREQDPIVNEVYSNYLAESPIFTKGDIFKLREFITKYIKKPDHKETLYIIENGKIRPSKSLQDSLLKMLEGNEEFIMIDEQKEAFEEALAKARISYRTGKKNVLIVEGGPGTGKSVLAINLLVKLSSEGLVCQYVTKNQAPREVYSNKLQRNYRKTFIQNLFKGSGVYYDAEKNEFDALIVDEAHRLGEKSGMFKNKGENQTKEIINASKFSVFFIDESQRIHIDDAGKKEEIYKYAKQFNAEIVEMKLESQFRCNGSDGYIAWLDDVLEIHETANYDGFEFDYDFQVVSSPNDLRDLIFEKNKINNKARIVAGYCWDWNSEDRNNESSYDISIQEFDFNMSWNLGNTTTWAIDKDSVNQIGCIHTSQGLEFDYIGVIIGNDLRYDGKRILTDFTKRAKTDQSLKGIKRLYEKEKNKAIAISDEIIKNTYRTLMSRGQKGCYVYCCDESLGKYLKERLKLIMNKEKANINEFIRKKAAEDSDEFLIDE
ncbi:MAG: DNA/RNA helicase domain-containing protein [Ignavibacteriales bacterium]